MICHTENRWERWKWTKLHFSGETAEHGGINERSIFDASSYYVEKNELLKMDFDTK